MRGLRNNFGTSVAFDGTRGGLDERTRSHCTDRGWRGRGALARRRADGSRPSTATTRLNRSRLHPQPKPGRWSVVHQPASSRRDGADGGAARRARDRHVPDRGGLHRSTPAGCVAPDHHKHADGGDGARQPSGGLAEFGIGAVAVEARDRRARQPRAVTRSSTRAFSASRCTARAKAPRSDGALLENSLDLQLDFVWRALQVTGPKWMLGDGFISLWRQVDQMDSLLNYVLPKYRVWARAQGLLLRLPGGCGLRRARSAELRDGPVERQGGRKRWSHRGRGHGHRRGHRARTARARRRSRKCRCWSTPAEPTATAASSARETSCSPRAP